MGIIDVVNLKKYFPIKGGILSKPIGYVYAVDGVSFDVQAGQIFGIVGESGCGKSVTVKSVLRIVEAPGKIVHGQILLRRPCQDGTVGQEEVDLASLVPKAQALLRFLAGRAG